MNYKVSYPSNFSSEGTHYSQTINMTLCRDEFRKLNYDIAVCKLNNRHTMFGMYLDTFKKGVNYTKLTQCRFLVTHFGLIGDKRIKSDRNTIVKVTII